MATTPPEPSHSAVAKAICLDLPYILDSVWRRAEFNLNRLISCDLVGTPATGVQFTVRRRVYTHVLPFWFFLTMLVFVAYGPTFDAWCSIVGPTGMYYLRATLGIAVIALAIVAWIVLARYAESRAQKRFLKARVPDTEVARRRLVRAGVQIAVLCAVSALGVFGAFLFDSRNTDVCQVHPPVPSDLPARYQALLLFAVIGLTFLLARRAIRSASRLYEQVAVLLGMVLVLWLVIVPTWASEANQSPYVHTYGVFACALALLACCTRPLAHWQFGTVSDKQREMYRAALDTTELFPGSRQDPDISTRRVLAAFFTGIFYHVLEFLLLPSFFALMVPSRALGWTVTGISMVAAWLLMSGNFTSRWQAMISQVRRWFLIGTPLAVSIAVIALAILRLAQVSYVATVLDAAPFGVIFVWIVMAYALLWWFEFVINRTVAAELIAIVGTPDDVKNGYLRYLPHKVPTLSLNVELQDRYIVAHGAGRFAAVGWFIDKDSHQPVPAFQAFDLMELFERLTPAGLEDLWHDLKRRIELYFLTVNFGVFAVLFAGYLYYGYGDSHNTVTAVISTNSSDNSVPSSGTTAPSAGSPAFSSGKSAPASGISAPPADLAKLLKAHKRAFIIAASGGGTRAALFTAAALDGLQQLGVAKDIVLLSGVSGGGVAEAYFYTHRDALLAGAAPHNPAWKEFEDHMTEPFIGDVLEGAGEWRLMSREPLGELLIESFERRLFLLGNRQATMGESNQLALILNTTIAAHPQEDSDLLRGAFLATKSADPSCDVLHSPYAMMGGGRLIFTNLSNRDAFPPSGAVPPTDGGLHLPDVRLPFVVVQDRGVHVANAASLNANFPPVFTNARVDVPSENPDSACPRRSYYVTDGGATENLGLLSALYALRGALKTLDPADIPEIHIVTIEASASAYDYTPDRGLNAATGGSKERLTGGLTQELLDDVQNLAMKPTGDSRRVQIHDLALPLAFRSRGGFGTHWMFPNSIVVENPRIAAPPKWYWRELEKWFSKDPPSAVVNKIKLEKLWSALFDKDQQFCAQSWQDDQRRIADWVCGVTDTPGEALQPDVQIGEWRGLIESLKPPQPPAHP